MTTAITPGNPKNISLSSISRPLLKKKMMIHSTYKISLSLPLPLINMKPGLEKTEKVNGSPFLLTLDKIHASKKKNILLQTMVLALFNLKGQQTKIVVMSCKSVRRASKESLFALKNKFL